MTLEKYCTRKQAAKLAGVEPQTIDNWAKRGLIEAVEKYGKKLIVTESVTDKIEQQKGQDR